MSLIRLDSTRHAHTYQSSRAKNHRRTRWSLTPLMRAVDVEVEVALPVSKTRADVRAGSGRCRRSSRTQAAIDLPICGVTMAATLMKGTVALLCDTREGRVRGGRAVGGIMARLPKGTHPGPTHRLHACMHPSRRLALYRATHYE
jgi:hypothetical protein